MVGQHLEGKASFVTAPLHLGTGAENRRMAIKAYEILDQLDLAHLAFRPCAGLPFGTMKRIELARALASDAKLILLDEPASGLTHSEVHELGELICDLRDRFKLTVLLVEHHMGMVMGI
jgi:branched-chain amino acid transport system ATP-binding protein